MVFPCALSSCSFVSAFCQTSGFSLDNWKIEGTLYPGCSSRVIKFFLCPGSLKASNYGSWAFVSTFTEAVYSLKVDASSILDHRQPKLKLRAAHNKQLLDEVEQNIVICLWRADQLFASAFGIGK